MAAVMAERLRHVRRANRLLQGVGDAPDAPEHPPWVVVVEGFEYSRLDGPEIAKVRRRGGGAEASVRVLVDCRVKDGRPFAEPVNEVERDLPVPPPEREHVLRGDFGVGKS